MLESYPSQVGVDLMPTRLPRVNVTVTEEQHALLLELAELNGGSAAGYLRQMLDQATPLIRATVPALRMAADEMNTTRQAASEQLEALLDAIRQSGAGIQPDLLDRVSRAAQAPQDASSSAPRARGRGRGVKRA